MHGCIRQLHTYLLLLIPRKSAELLFARPAQVARVLTGKGEKRAEVQRAVDALEAARLETASELGVTAAVRLPRSGAEHSVLLRLLPYCDGKHHLTEVWWRESIPRKSVRQVLGAYSEVVAPCMLTDRNGF